MNSQRSPKPIKVSEVASLKEWLAKSKSVAFLDYTGLKVNQATQLRQDIRKAGGEVKVTKNTLFQIAAGIPELKLSGLSAFVFSTTDEISALKALSDFVKKAGVGIFKGGLLGSKILTDKEVVALANTPSRETSVGKILYLLNFNMSKLVRTLDAVAKRGGDRP